MKNTQEVGTLLLRLFLGLTFFMHGFDKIQGGVGNFAAGFPAMGLPSFTGYMVTFIELVGGIALILGIGTRLFSILIASVMVGAILFVKLPEGFIGGYEFNIALFVSAAHLTLNGSSLFSLDTKIVQLLPELSRNRTEQPIE
ncbi:DoxX family protein [Chungangia koreensis]|uniref:DoxX family protein n=1 Tax=Chungangia koreensis TaxID=752657 RepID=A0ABV8X1N5_9LACT